MAKGIHTYLDIDCHIFRVTGKCAAEYFCYQNSSSCHSSVGILGSRVSSRVSSRVDFRAGIHLFTGIRAVAKFLLICTCTCVPTPSSMWAQNS